MRAGMDMILRGIRMLFEMGMQGTFLEVANIGGGEKMFLEVLYRSVIAGGTVLVIFLLRILMRRVPRIYCYLLWALVLYRLLCPFTFVSHVSLLRMFDKPETGYIQLADSGDLTQTQTQGVSQTKQTQPSVTTASDVVAGQEGVYLPQEVRKLLRVSSYIWIAGAALVLMYGIVSLLYFISRLRGAVKVRKNIYLSDYVPTPFVMGIIHPRIYLPSFLAEQEWEYIIMHERTHIRRGDHIIRLLSFLALAVYWFHPLIWAAFYLSGKDMEMSCDEAVMNKMEQDIRADYSTSLLHLASGRWLPGGIPLAFGEKDVRKRIENVMHWRVPKPGIVAAALAVVMVAMVILGTDPMPTWRVTKQLRQTADAWAQAVCGRDGNRIAELCTKEVREQLKQEELLSGTEGDYSFGWSSPWPWEAQYRMIECKPQETVILYYAWTSDPHVTVWQERLVWRLEDSGYLAAESSMYYLDGISDSESFETAYGGGISGTPMDYLTNGAGEALHGNALQNRQDGWYYPELFAPQTAARILLNLAEDEEKVAVSAGDIQADGSVEVSITFQEEGKKAAVKMIQPYGTDGIWIPQD